MNRLTFRSLIIASVLFVLFSVPSIASADGVTWTFSGLTFDDGGTASGSFNYDAVAGTYSSIDITTTLGTAFGGATYTGFNALLSPSSTGIILLTDPSLPDLTGTGFFYLLFSAALTNSGGTVPVS